MRPRSPIAANLALAFAFSAVVLTAYVAGERHNDSAVISAPACPTMSSYDIGVAGLQESTADAAADAVEKDRLGARQAAFEALDRAALAKAKQSALEEEDLNKVRQAARDLVREKYGGSRVEGVFTLPLARSGFYLAGADTFIDKENRVTYYMLVSLYVRKNGASYWRAESLGNDEAAALMRQK